MLNDIPIVEDFKKSVENLEEVLNLKRTKVVRDSAIKRFELCFDLAWKSTKEYAKLKGFECYSPIDCFKAGFQLKIIQHNEKWVKMVKDRNLSVHTYKEEAANKLYSKLSGYLKLFKELKKKIENH
jgi:nucleotidyltransferase substrate binding protein (TIGR01987 family)